jgi:hypothetical protein
MPIRTTLERLRRDLEEWRTKFVKATKFHRKSGGTEAEESAVPRTTLEMVSDRRHMRKITAAFLGYLLISLSQYHHARKPSTQ